MAGKQGAHVLDAQVALDHGLGQVAEDGGGQGRDAGDDALPPVTVQHRREHDRARHDAEESGAPSPSQVFFGETTGASCARR